MRSRHALTAALVLSVVTILTVAACGSSVQGSAQVNTAAAETIAAPTDLSDLSSMLDALPTAVPTDLSLPSDLTFPSELYGGDCLAVQGAYASILLAITTGSDTVDGQSIQDALDSLGGEIPPELAPDVQAMKEIAEEAKGKSLLELGELFSSEKYTEADAHLQEWLNANCGG